MSKSFCHGRHLKASLKVVNQCFCTDYYHSSIPRIKACKAYKPKKIIRAVNAMKISNKRCGITNSIVDYCSMEFLKCLNPKYKYIIYVRKGAYPEIFDIFTVEDAKKFEMFEKKGK